MRTFYLVLWLLFSTVYCAAQNKMATGIVRNSRGSRIPIDGAQIWNNNKPNNITYSQQDGKFELSTTGERVLINCEKDGFLPFGKWVTLPEFNMDIFLEPKTPESIELIIAIKDADTQNLLDSIEFFYENINGYDRSSKDKKQTFHIPLQLVELNNNSLKLNIYKKGYQTLSQNIIFNEDDKTKRFKTIELYLKPKYSRVILDSKLNGSTNTSYVSILLPGLYQFNTKQTKKGIIFLTGEIVSIIGIVVSHSMYTQNFNNSNLNKGSAIVYNTYNNRADNWYLSRNVFIGTSIAFYLYNIFDCLFLKPINIKKNNTLFIYPYIKYQQTGLSLLIDLN